MGEEEQKLAAANNNKMVFWAILIVAFIAACLAMPDMLYFGAIFLTWKAIDFAWRKVLPKE